MKPVQLFCFFISLLLLASCSKDVTATASIVGYESESSGSIAGSWELRMLYGIQVPGMSPYFSTGNGNIKQFHDSTYQYYENGNLSSTGTYILTKDTSEATGKLMDALILVQEHDRKIHFEIVKDTLTLYDGTIAACGTIQKYVRMETRSRR